MGYALVKINFTPRISGLVHGLSDDAFLSLWVWHTPDSKMDLSKVVERRQELNDLQRFQLPMHQGTSSHRSLYPHWPFWGRLQNHFIIWIITDYDLKAAETYLEAALFLASSDFAPPSRLFCIATSWISWEIHGIRLTPKPGLKFIDPWEQTDGQSSYIEGTLLHKKRSTHRLFEMEIFE